MSSRPTIADRLWELAEARTLDYRGVGSDGTLAILIGGHRRIYPPVAMSHWLAGFDAAANHTPPRVRPADAAKRRAFLQFLRPVLVNPDYEDQWRIEIRQRMEAAGVGVVELAARAGVNRKHLTDDLRFGHPGTFSLLAHLGVFDEGGVVSAARADADPDAPTELRPPGGVHEPTRMGDLRILAVLHEAGLVDWLGPRRQTARGMGFDPSHLMSCHAFHVAVGGVRHTVRAGVVRVWSVGVADRLTPTLGQQIYRLGTA